MPSIIYNDDVEMYDSSYYSGGNTNTNTSDQSTPGTNPEIDPYPVTDDTTRTADGWSQNTNPDGGSGGQEWPNIPPSEKDPLQYYTKTIKEKTKIILHDYSDEYLENLNTQGFRFYAVYTDGTTDEVNYTEVFDPHKIDANVVVNEAYDIAQAINQYFWEDTNGAHVTDETKDDWDAAISNAFSDLSPTKQYHNILINSLGMLLRSALNNLVSLSRSGMTIFDGLGNELQNVLASFTSEGAAFRESGKTRATITTQGLTVYDDSGSVSNGTETYGAQVAFIGIDEYGKPYSRIGKAVKGYIEIGVNSNDHGYIDFYNRTTQLAHIGYDAGIDEDGNISDAPYYSFGSRNDVDGIGNFSFVEGNNNRAPGYAAHSEGTLNKSSGFTSHTEGYHTTASDYFAHAEGEYTTASSNAAHSEGSYTTASGQYSHAEGRNTTASGRYSHAEGYYTVASGMYAHATGCYTTANHGYLLACGKYNRPIANISTGIQSLFEVGYGSSTSDRKNAFVVLDNGGAYYAGTTSANGTQVTSDARVKELIDELTSEAATEFITQLKPKHYYKEGIEEYGFYAQEVEEIPEFGKVLVTKDNTGVYDIPDYRLLNYQGMLAPIVSVEQNLLARVEQLEQENEELKQRNQDLMERLNRIERMLGI